MNKWEKIREQHPNSLNAYYDGLLDQSFSKREHLIIKALKLIQKGTDREIMNTLGFTDMNAVRPRITELIKKAGLVDECGSKYDDVSGKPVRIVRLIPDQRNYHQAQLFAS